MIISVIIPTLNEAAVIEKTLDALSRLVNISEIVIVDGGSADRTCEIVENYVGTKEIKLIRSSDPNRGKQLNIGAENAVGDVLWFVHADTRPVQGCGKQIKELMRYDEIVGGNFKLIFDGNSRWAAFLTKLYPQLRSIGLVYGDSAIFARRQTFEAIGGYRDLPLFEDVDLYKRLLKKGDFVQVDLPVTTSSRRFENRSFLWTFVKWSVFQGLYWLGFPPKILARGYKPIRKLSR
ncbi:MAG: TIGR04283 family arsenosugar biosynthesis glycosyltransferase [Pyrinomonadaceae bacterium]|nr:TIGR04283 family arsenosugar biosynthesis glycosyltransferase [Pyrinomonadaceae bacterium]